MKTQHPIFRKVPRAVLAAIMSLSLTLRPAYAVDPLPGTILSGSNSIDAGGGVVDGNNSTGFFVGSGSLTISNATLQNFYTQGGSGSGGGAGLGGAVFVNSNATVTLNNVNFTANDVRGGTGGAGISGGVLNNIATHLPDIPQTVTNPQWPTSGPEFITIMVKPAGYGNDGAAGYNADSGAAYVNGGNGGNGYNGQIGFNGTNGFGGSGGSGGNGSDGAAVTADTVKTSLDVTYDYFTSGNDTTLAAAYTAIATNFTTLATEAAAEANGGGPTAEALAPSFTALAAKYTQMAADIGTTKFAADNGKAIFDAAYLTAITVTNLQVGVAGNGGAGGNGAAGGNSSDFYGGGAGGAGGSGGNAYSGSTAQGGAGGNGGYGGTGGFGGGGGAGGNGGTGGTSAYGQDGVQGGGGAGGLAGFGAGNGASGAGFGALVAGGSGGDGYGGAIFVRKGGTLIITGNATFNGNGAHGGSGQQADSGTTAGAAGSSAGSDLFMMTGSSVTLNPGAGNIITFNGDPSGSSIADDSAASGVGSPIASGQGADIHIASGLVQFNGTDTYSGQTIIDGGTLQAQDGVGIYYDSNINFAGTLTSDSVLMSNGTFTRYVGPQSNRVQWTGSGGFAAAGGDLTVNLGNGQTMTWNKGGFVTDGNALVFGALQATDNVYFQNSMDLNGGSRSILATTSTAATGTNADGTPTGSTVYVQGNIMDVAGGGSLSINDANHDGTVVLQGASTYTGATTVNNGTVDLTGSLASASVNVETGATLNSTNGGLAATAAVTNHGTLNLGATNDTVASLTNSGTLNGTGTLTAATYNLNDGSVINAQLGTGTLNTAGTVTLNNTVGAGVIDVTNGSTLNLAAPDIVAHTAAVTVDGTLNLTGGAETIQSLMGSGTVNTNGNMLSVADGSTFLGNLNAPNTSLTTGSSGNGGSLNLSGGTTTTQSTEIDNGLTVGSGATLNSTTITIANGSVLDLSGGGTINFTTLTTPSGSAPGIINIGSNDFIVPVGSTISGNIEFIGTGNVIIEGTISPGHSPGITDLTGAGLSPVFAGAFKAELAGSGGVGGLDFDQVQLAAGATLTISNALNVANYGGFMPTQGETFQIISGPGGAVPINHLTGTFSTVTFDADGIAGPNPAVTNAAVIFDVNTGALTATGLNSDTSTVADLGSTANQRAAAASIFNAAFVGQNQIDSSTTAGKLALQIIDATGGSSGDLARYSPSYYGSLADYAFMGNQVLVRSVQDRVSPMNYIPSQVDEDSLSQVPETMSLFTGYTYAYQNTADAARAMRNDYYAGMNLLASEDYVFGVAGSGSSGSIHSALGSAKSDGWGAMAFGRYVVAKSFTFFGSFGFNQQNMHVTRQTVNGTVGGATDVTSYVGFVGVQYKGWRAGGVSFAPRVSFSYSNSTVGGFNESGAIDALNVSGYHNNRVMGEAGVSALWSTDITGHVLNVEVATSVQQYFQNTKSQMAVNVASVPSASYGVNFAKVGNTQAVVQVNMGYEITKAVTGYVGYEGHYGNQSMQYAKAGIRFNF